MVSASTKPWRKAMEDFLAVGGAANGQPRDLEEVLAIGAAEVPAERALQEMGSKQSGQPEERRVEIGKRNVAMQGITGMTRFGSHKYFEGRKKVGLAGSGDSTSPGDLRARIEALEAQVALLLDFQQSAQAELDRIEAASEEGAQAGDPGEQFLASAGVPAG